MTVLLYALGVWIFASVPTALLVGAACHLNRLSDDGGELLNPEALAHGQPQVAPARRTSELAAA